MNWTERKGLQAPVASGINLSCDQQRLDVTAERYLRLEKAVGRLIERLVVLQGSTPDERLPDMEAGLSEVMESIHSALRTGDRDRLRESVAT